VDDNPANNEVERASLRPSGIIFDNVVSTQEATDQIAFESYDLVITDLGRPGSSDRSFTAGYAFLDHPSVRKAGPPVIVYTNSYGVAKREELISRGASEVISDRDKLIETVLRLLGRGPQEPPRGLRR
jgi:CheY-like chemotaxis protein